MIVLWLWSLARAQPAPDEVAPPPEPAADADPAADPAPAAGAADAPAPPDAEGDAPTPASDAVSVETLRDDDDPFVDPDCDPEIDYCVVVVGWQQVRAAQDAVVRKMESLGWKARRKSDQRIVFRGPEGWMGKAILMPTGDIEFTTPVLAFAGASNTGATYDQSNPVNQDAPVGGAGVETVPFPGKKKVGAIQDELHAEIRPLVKDFQRKIQGAHFGEYIGELPERFEALWAQGVSLDGGDPIADPATRRAQLLDFWSTRTDTREGRVVSRVVESFLRNVVMDSAHPVTAEEAERAEARRRDGRTLGLF